MRSLLYLPVPRDDPGHPTALVLRPIHKPAGDSASGRVAPEDIRFAIAIEVAHPHDLPVPRDDPGYPTALVLRPIHKPDGDSAAGRVAPEGTGVRSAREVGRSHE